MLVDRYIATRNKKVVELEFIVSDYVGSVKLKSPHVEYIPCYDRYWVQVNEYSAWWFDGLPCECFGWNVGRQYI